MSDSTTMPSTLNVNGPGFVKSMLSSGGTIADAIKEKVDNAHDAVAQNITIGIASLPVETGDVDPVTKNPVTEMRDFFYCSDDGCGFTQVELENYHTAHDRKPASNKIGLMGFGGTMSESLISNNEGISKTLSVSEKYNKLVCKDMDWKALANGRGGRGTAVAAAGGDATTWAKLKQAKRNGTVSLIELPTKYTWLLATPEDVHRQTRDLGITYHDSIRDGLKLSVVAKDGVVHCVAALDPLSRDNIPSDKREQKESKNFKAVQEIEIWRDPAGNAKVFMTDHKKDGTAVKRQMVTSVHKPSRKTAAGPVVPWLTNMGSATAIYPPKGYVKFATLQMSSSRLNGNNDGGRIYLKRGPRVTTSFPSPVNNGTTQLRNATHGSNHMIDLDFTCDWLTNPEFNKSRANADNINKDLWAMIQALASMFSFDVFSTLFLPEIHTIDQSTVRGATDSGSEGSAEAEDHVSDTEAAPPPETKVVVKLNTEDEMQKVLTAETFAEWKREALALQSRYLA